MENKKCYSLKYLVQKAKNILRELDPENYDSQESTLTTAYLLKKIKNKFGDDLQVVALGHKKMIAPKGVCVKDPEETFRKCEELELIERAALIMREKILSIKARPLSGNTTDSIKGEFEIPADVSEFFKSIICNHTPSTENSCDCADKVNSHVQDIIYAVSHGKVQTPKHIELGMSLKSMTSNRTVIDILSRYGHCCSYKTLQKLEAEDTFASCSKSSSSIEDVAMDEEQYEGTKICTRFQSHICYLSFLFILYCRFQWISKKSNPRLISIAKATKICSEMNRMQTKQ